MLTLAREPEPDMSAYTDPEIVARIQKHHHAGLILATDDSTRLDDLITGYADRFHHDFMAWHPAPDSPSA